MLSMFECFRQGYKCTVCKTEINVLRYLGAIDAEGKFLVKTQDIPALISRLPVRPAAVGEQAGPRFIDAGGDGDGGVGYEPSMPTWV